MVSGISCVRSLSELSLTGRVSGQTSQGVGYFIRIGISKRRSGRKVGPRRMTSFVSYLTSCGGLGIVNLVAVTPLSSSRRLLHSYFQGLGGLRAGIGSLKFSFTPYARLSVNVSGSFSLTVRRNTAVIEVNATLMNRGDRRI